MSSDTVTAQDGAAGQRKASNPAFTQTMQIGIVVPDVEAAARSYEQQFGIGDWQIMDVDSENTEDVRLYGEPVEWKSKIAVTMVGNVMWELIQPVREGDLFGQFLSQRGGVGGVHHIAVRTPDFQSVVQQESGRGKQPILSGTFSGIEVQYLDTERELGVILEVFSGFPEGVNLPTEE